MLRPDRSHATGVALIEALVAMAVMAFGLLAVAGVQTSLRFNADVSKQRAEAVRIAQEELERWRAFHVMATTPGKLAYGDLVSGTGTAVAGSNANYSVIRSVTTLTAPAYKVLTIDVTWTDRSETAQSVRLTSNLAGVLPELAGTVAVRAYGSPTAHARNRHSTVPLAAVPLSDGRTSAFRPPQANNGNIVWRFDNSTGLISICETTASNEQTLTIENISGCDGRAQLLSGFVRFATDDGPASADDTVAPNSPSFPVSVRVIQSFPEGHEDTVCFTEHLPKYPTPEYPTEPYPPPTYIRYYCAVPVSGHASDPPIWSGRAVLGTSSLLTATDTETSANLRRVCRYTRYREDRTVGTASDQMLNEEHPLNYTNVGGPLSNQNFLLIKAGNGATTPESQMAYGCPENTAQPIYNTWRHPLN